MFIPVYVYSRVFSFRFMGQMVGGEFQGWSKEFCLALRKHCPAPPPPPHTLTPHEISPARTRMEDIIIKHIVMCPILEYIQVVMRKLGVASLFFLD